MKTNQLTLPMFPLNLVLLPGETCKLYIFEQRYRQMVEECLLNGASFGVPFIERGELKEYGSELKIKRVLKTYENGSMDILVEGVRLFRLKTFKEVLRPKLYGAGTIEPIESEPRIIMNNLQDAVVNYYNSVEDKLTDYETVSKLTIYKVAAGLQLSASEKFRLITTAHQQQYLLNILNFRMHVLRCEQELKGRFAEN
jgi:uncharacterized protein